MIVVEDQLRFLVERMDKVIDASGNELNHVFHWGDESQLIDFMSIKKSINTSIYPLVWYSTNSLDFENHRRNKVNKNVRIIISMPIKGVQLNQLNPYLWESLYKNVLNIYAENLLKAIYRTNHIHLVDNDNYQISNAPKFKIEEGGQSVDVWCSKIFQADLEFNGNIICNR